MTNGPVPVGRPSVLRHTNALSVLKLLRQVGPCSKADLVRASGLSAPTITNVVNDLLAEDLIEPLGEGASSGGRPPDMIRFKAERGCVLAVNITAGGISFLLADLSATLLCEHSVSLAKRDTTPRVICSLINEEVRKLLRQQKLKPEQLLALVVGVPAITDVEQGMVLSISTLQDWRSVPLRAMLSKYFDCLVVIENDTNLAAQGERFSGAAKGVESFILITIGDGIGAGIVLNGKIHHGSQWSAGEIGYMRLPQISRRGTTINEFGELEAVLSKSGILQRWKDATKKKSVAGKKQSRVVDASNVFKLAQVGNVYAEKIVEHCAAIVTDIIVNLSLILNPGLILLSGAVGSNPVLIAAVKKQLQECEFAVTDISAGALGDGAVLWGGISLGLDAIPLVLLPPG